MPRRPQKSPEPVNPVATVTLPEPATKTEGMTGGSRAVYFDRAGANRDPYRTEGAANIGEMQRQALLSVEEAKAREREEARVAKEREKAARYQERVRLGLDPDGED